MATMTAAHGRVARGIGTEWAELDRLSRLYWRIKREGRASEEGDALATMNAKTRKVDLILDYVCAMSSDAVWERINTAACEYRDSIITARVTTEDRFYADRQSA